MAESTAGHHVAVVKDGPWWMPYCGDCDWIGANYSKKGLARDEARMHERGERHPWQPAEVAVWTPERRPFQGT